MKIGHFSDRGASFIGAVFGDSVFDLSAVSAKIEKDPLPDLTTLFHEQRFTSRLFHDLFMLGQYNQDFWTPLGLVSYAPLYRPGKIICMGLNYVKHAQEALREAPEEPVYFEKAASAVIAHEQAIKYPPDLGRIDPEGELAVIIGKRAWKVAADEARNYIAGYTILNDVTARDLQAKDVGVKRPWYRSKSIDTFCPMGPWIVTSNEIGPEDPLYLQLRVNGEIRQNSSTGNLIFKIPTLISMISGLITLEPGDVISTGTPEGVAPVYPGDVVEIEIENIGTLRNTVEKQST